MSCSYYDANSISSPITGSSNFSCTNTTRNSTMNPWAGISADDYLAELDARYSDRVFPAMFFLGVLMVAGVVGNAAVLYVYTCRARRQGGTVTRFIQALAVFDLLSCCLAIPGGPCMSVCCMAIPGGAMSVCLLSGYSRWGHICLLVV